MQNANKLNLFFLSSLAFALIASTLAAQPSKTDQKILDTYVLHHLQSKNKTAATEYVDWYLGQFPNDSYALELKSRLQNKNESLEGIISDLQSDIRWRILGSSRLGWHSNVLLLSDSALDLTSPSGTESMYLDLGADVERRRIAKTYDYAIGHQLLYRAYFNDDVEELSSIGGRLSLDASQKFFEASSGKIETNLIYNFTRDDGYSLFYAAPELAASIDTQIGESQWVQLRTPVRFHYYPDSDDISANNDRSGFGYEAQFKYRARIDGSWLTLGSDVEHQLADGKDSRNFGIRAPAYFVTRVGSVLWNIGGSYKYTRYYSHTTNRRDHSIYPGLQGKLQLTKNWQLTAQYSLLVNFSNLNASDYRRHDVSGGLNYEF